MTTEEKIQIISDLLYNELQRKDVRFTEGLVIKGSELRHVFTCMGAATDDQCRVWIMDNSGNWSLVKPGQVYADIILDALEEKLKTLCEIPL